MPLVGLTFSASSLKFLATIPKKMRSQILNKARALTSNQYPQGSKKLTGITTDLDEPVHRERSGDYRILYVVRNDPTNVVILDIDHRKDIY